MRFSQILAKFAVSLFTREWIEIATSGDKSSTNSVSLFTREWIEIADQVSRATRRGVSLFTREWIEILVFHVISAIGKSPSLRGSGLK